LSRIAKTGGMTEVGGVGEKTGWILKAAIKIKVKDETVLAEMDRES